MSASGGREALRGGLVRPHPARSYRPAYWARFYLSVPKLIEATARLIRPVGQAAAR
jgi:hypothetical protein